MLGRLKQCIFYHVQFSLLANLNYLSCIERLLMYQCMKVLDIIHSFLFLMCNELYINSVFCGGTHGLGPVVAYCSYMN